LTTTAVSPSEPRKGAADWRRAVEPYLGPDARRASFQLLTTLGPLALAVWGVWALLQTSMPWLALLLMLPIAGLQVRTFILMHDCAHGSFFANRQLNDGVGFITGVFTMTAFVQWRRDHALHHASSGDLDRRGHGDMPTLTVKEYLARSKKGRLAYRVVRHPLLWLLGGPFVLAVIQRFRGGEGDTATGPLQKASNLMTNVALVAFLATLVVGLGWKAALIGYVLPFYIAAMTGLWLFFVQHQFEDAYWTPHGEWNYVEASLRGSSYLRLPLVLRWFTGDIGVHHVHHIAPRIPNYRLQKCHDENEIFHQSPQLTLRTAMHTLRLALWDEDQKRLVTFREVLTS
jgi:omega-6 fatty acid desaturase (delta-12 desaturase)